MDENITPLAKKLAEENSIDWRFIRGTGPAGKVIERDILSYLARIMSGELDLPAMPDASEPAGPAAGSANMPDMGQVANFDLMSASMAKEGVDLNSMLGDFGTPTPAPVETPPVPEYDFSMPVTQVSSVTDDVVISSQIAGVAVPEVSMPEISMPEVAAPSSKPVEMDDAIFEFDLDDIDEVEPVAALHNPDLFPSEIAAPVITPSSSLAEDHIMTVSDDHDVVVPSDEVTLSPGNDDILVHVSGEFEPVPDPLENVAFELDAQSHFEPVQTLIVEDAILAPEPELVVDEIETPVAVAHEPAGISLEGLAAVGAGVLGVGAALGHAPSVNDLELELETPVAAQPVLAVEPEPVVAPAIDEPEIVQVIPEPMIAHFDPEPIHVEPEPVVVAEPVIALEPEPVVAPEPIHVEPEPVHVPEPVIALEPEPVHVPAEPMPTPIVIPAMVETPILESSSHAVAAPTSSVHKDFFNTNILRRQFNASALMDIRTQISRALNGREVQLGVFVGRAAQRGLYLLGTTDAVTLNRLEADLVPLSTAGLHHSFIEAVQSVNHADVGVANGLAVLDASGLGVDDLVLPASGALLALGQISNNMGTLTLSGDFPAKAGAEFLAHVAQALETPVGLVL
jgi:e3 binding domain